MFDAAPPGLTATPTLSAVVEAPHAGRYVIRLSYLATGLRWSADYVARLSPDGRDDLASDNQATVELPGIRPLAITVCAPQPRLLQPVLDSLPAVQREMSSDG